LSASADVPGLVRYIARTLADQPDAVEVSIAGDGKSRTVQLRLAPDDMGRVIGREGRVANAIRALLSEASDEHDWRLEILE